MNANDEALERYIVHCREIGERLAEMQEIVAGHFGRSPDQVNWGDVGTVADINRKLTEILAGWSA